ncbi:MAG: dephospho-CoA kinase [Pseudomonadota bacterium]
MTFKLGLTGSIGMGKTTTARMFAEAGCALWDADKAVHRLYSEGGEAVVPLNAIFPEAIRSGAVSREALKEIIRQNADALSQIEAIVHPLVAKDRSNFLRSSKAKITVFDVPLLFETGGDKSMDAVVCVTAPIEVQKERVLARGTMTEIEFEKILAKQIPDAEKRMRSDYVIETISLDSAKTQVQHVIEDITSRLENA